MSGGRCAVQERAIKAFGRRQKLDWDVFRSPIGVTFIRASKKECWEEDKPWNEGFGAYTFNTGSFEFDKNWTDWTGTCSGRR